MAEIINSSFIPKKEFKKKGEGRKGPRINIFFLISLVIFLTTIIASIGVYLWKIDLQKTNEASKKSIANKQDDYGIQSIKILSRLSNRIDAAKVLLNKHHNILPLFVYLEKNTLSDVTLTDFSVIEKDGQVFVSAKGQAPDLTDLQLQSRAYSTNPNISNLILSNITKSKEGFSVFDLEFSVDKRWITEDTLVINNTTL